ncbi:ADP-ribose pyrophosphatase [Jeotgalibacillus campisalis]|uniref:ADP-ribose pyrophosphatase n=1 Tax=Jeotgalibacillus campisalis TaxID=220754 RepID=A0A0C2RNA7_9BACL|nr:ADP-ribose pyrophosphatase [Jeotgalibacillus campisalis]
MRALNNSSEEEFLKVYDSGKYVTPDGYTSDIAVFTIVSEKNTLSKIPKKVLKLMLIKRHTRDHEGNPNIEGGKWALPGGFVHPDETAYEAAVRELEEETSVKDIHLQHYQVYDQPGRDPRGWILSNAHYAIVKEQYLDSKKANDDAQEVELFSMEEIESLNLAFDHEKIVKDAFDIIKREMIQTPLAKEFLPKEFIASELQNVLLTVTDKSSIKGKSAWSRKIKNLSFIEPVLTEEGQPKTTQRFSDRPSALFRFVDREVPLPSLY